MIDAAVFVAALATRRPLAIKVDPRDLNELCNQGHGRRQRDVFMPRPTDMRDGHG